jgi:hypothetical protein
MMMNNLEIIDTELGRIPVIINEVIEDGELRYDGRMLYDDIKISIQTPTKESCLAGLKNGFEIQMHFWLYKELFPINIDLRNE